MRRNEPTTGSAPGGLSWTIAVLAAVVSVSGAAATRWGDSSGALQNELAAVRSDLGRVRQRLSLLEDAGPGARPGGGGTAAAPAAPSLPGETRPAPRSDVSPGAPAARAEAAAANDLTAARAAQDPAGLSQEAVLANALIRSAEERRTSFVRLVQSDPRAAMARVRTLVEQADDNPRVASAAAAALELLGKSEDRSVESDLHEYLRSPLPVIREAAARTLEGRGDFEPVQAWIDDTRGQLSSPDVGARARATDELARTASPRAVSAILPMLSDTSTEVRLRAVIALARTGSASVIPALEPLLRDEVPAVRDMSVRVIRLLRNGGPRAAVSAGK